MLYVIDVPVMAYDATGYGPGFVRDVLMEEGKKVVDEACTRARASAAIRNASDPERFVYGPFRRGASVYR